MIKNPNRNYVKKGWGYEDWIDNNELYCGKILHVEKNKKISVHYHILKTETFFLKDGLVKLLFYSDANLDSFFSDWEKVLSSDNIQSIDLYPGDSFFIPKLLRHSVFAYETSNIIEFSTTHYDEDSIRILKGD